MDTIETLIGSDVEEADPLMSHDEEVGSPLKGRVESLNPAPINFKESRLDVDGDDVEHFAMNKDQIESEAS